MTVPASPDGATPHPRRRIALALTAVYLLWGSSYLFSRVGVQHLPPFLFAAVRFITAGTLMLSWSRATGERVQLSPQEWRNVGILALLGFFISNGINIWSLQFVRSNVSALLNASVPCWIALLSALGPHGQRPGHRNLTGLALGIAGTALVMRTPPGAEHVGLLPQLLILLGCLAWSFATLYQRQHATAIAVSTLIGWQMLLGGCGLLMVGLATGEVQRWNWSPAGLWCMAWLIFFSSCLAHTAYAWLARHTSPNSLGTYAYINPMIATVLGWLVLDESLTGRQLLGMVVVLTGVLLINWPAGSLAAAGRHLRKWRLRASASRSAP